MFLRTSPTGTVLAFLVAIATACLTGCGPVGINGPVDIPAGTTAESATTINGGVTVGDGAKVGEAATVNGGIRLGADSTTSSARTVNGGIDVGNGAHIAENVEAVNGGIHLGNGADVGGSLTNINGGIRIDSAHVGKGISTYNGDIEISNGSHIEGGIHVQKPDFGNESMKRVPRIVIGNGAVVDGTLKFDRDVKLLVSDGAKIGPVEGATVQLFSGDDTSHLVEPAAADATGAAQVEADAPPGQKPAKPAEKAAAGAAQKQ
jgi:hypothetical protein